MQDRCLQFGAATTQVPIISTELMMTVIMSGNFGTTDLDDLTQGLTP
jgi:hypothetical protein